MKKTNGEKIFNILNVVFMLLISVVFIYPAVSLNEGMDTASGGITIFPRKFTLQNYRVIFKNSDFLMAAGVSVSRVILNLICSLATVYSAAYGLTRKNLPYKRVLTLFLMIPAYISAGTIPHYITYRYLGLINSYFVYIIPTLFSFYNMVIIRSFLQDMPPSIEESAKIDGATDATIMLKIAFPLSLPVVATVALWIAVASWNDWTTTLMYVMDKKLYTIQYLMMKLIKESEVAQSMASEAAQTGSDVTFVPTSESVKSATLIVTTLPIILVYPFLQKYFIKGVTLGAVKE